MDGDRRWIFVVAGVWIGAVLLAVSSIAVAQDGESGPTLVATDVVATVDGEDIEAEAFNELVRDAGNLQEWLPRPVVEKFAHQALDVLIEDKLVARRLREAGIDEDCEEVEAEIDEASRGADRFDDDELSTARQKLTSRWNTPQQRRRQAMLDVYLRREYGLGVSQREVRQFFEEHRPLFDSSEMVNLRKIRIGIEPGQRQAAQHKADELYEAIAGDKKSFYDAEVEASDSPLTDDGGQVGYVQRSGLVDEVAQVAFEMNRGELSEPIESDYAFFIIEVLDRRPEKKAEFDDHAEGIERMLVNNERQRLHGELIDDLIDDADIERHEDHIDIRVEPEDGAKKEHDGRD